MPKGETTPANVKEAVRKLVFRNPDITAKDLKQKVDKDIGVNLTERTYLNLKNKLQPKALELKAGLLESVFTLGSLRDYDGLPGIPPEAIPHILRVQAAAHYPVTVRRARWIAYLQPVVKDTERLKWLSLWYAMVELLADLSDDGTRLDTGKYDAYLADKRFDDLAHILSDDVGNYDWAVQDNVLATATHYEVGEWIREIVIRGRKAYGVQRSGPDIELGGRLAVLSRLKLTKNIAKMLDSDSDTQTVVILNWPILPTPEQKEQTIKDGE